MLKIVRVVALLAAAAVPAGATAFNGSANWAGFPNGDGCPDWTIDSSGLSVSDTTSGFHLTGSLSITGAPASFFSCSLVWDGMRELAEPIGTQMITSVAQTANLQISGDWVMRWYEIAAYLDDFCGSVSLARLSPTSGPLNLGSLSGPVCATGQGSTPDHLHGRLYFGLQGTGAGSVIFNFGNSAEFSTNPLNPVPEPATWILLSVAAAAMIRCRTGRASAKPSLPASRA